MIKRNTRQKKLIFSCLEQRTDHPSAGMLYEQVRQIDPHISKGTVYRVLADAAAEGMILRLSFPGTDDRFDYLTEGHYHIRCRMCGRVSDVRMDYLYGLEYDIHDSGGFTVEGHNMEFYGLCPECSAKSEAV